MPFSGHDMATMLINSKELWFPAQDRHEVKPARIPAQMGGALQASPFTEERLELRAAKGEREHSFFFFFRLLLLIPTI